MAEEVKAAVPDAAPAVETPAANGAATESKDAEKSDINVEEKSQDAPVTKEKDEKNSSAVSIPIFGRTLEKMEQCRATSFELIC
jgi:hypothetical protein